MLKVLECMLYEHDLVLVAVSALICVLGCCATTTLLARSLEGPRRHFAGWLTAAAGVFACSVWALHFVAMLAFLPGRAMVYRVDLTALSMVAAFAGALVAFSVALAPDRRRIRVPAGGVVLGLAISGMHYLGVAALSSSASPAFDATTVAASVLVGVGGSTLAVAGMGDLRTLIRRAGVAMSLALAICGLHFTAMAAVTLVPHPVGAGSGSIVGTASLGAAVGGIACLILACSLVAVVIERHLSLRARQELARMRLMSNLAQEVLIVHRDGVVCEVNNAGERLFRAPARHLAGRRLLSLFAEESHAALIRRERCPPAKRRPEEIEIRPVGGTPVAVEISCQTIDHLGRPATVVVLRDLTDRKRNEARIRHLARHDALTDLPNRYDLQERIDLALDHAAREGGQFAVIYIDLDRFKPVNDLYGHAVGDAVLVQVARRIAVDVDLGDTLARIGGDEFIVVQAAAASADRSAALVARMLDSLRQPFTVEGKQIEIGASIGVALYPQDGSTADALLRAADAAMYRAKEGGGGAACFYKVTMNDRLQARLRLGQELAGAVGRGELVLHYQPIVNGITGEVETFEALIRWNHPVRGLVPPVDFIPLAEETGLIGEIGRWVIEAACREAAAWPHPWRVSVNVSPKQFRRTDVCEILAAAIRENGLLPARVVVEVTEGVLIDDAATAVATLQRLRDMGVRVALDDFGTGYSSLSYLQLFKFDKFKIDKSFVRRLGESEDALTLTRTIVNLGHNLGLLVTAEGVETRSQLAILRSLGCDQIQGYLVAKPAPIGSFTPIDRLRTMALFREDVDPASPAQGAGLDAPPDREPVRLGAHV
ncbi:bifunctional diguanylate cyclase/phosphodiesterase [Lichenibacterium dinghuense]|uniref:bifunctional diguanylate cyclase/phosphodiesterase n=1 Tax=Lichenibacterium dinghuense TaxID=2895977 RepID=UPI001F29C263|nr:EAL domain-containing protein [Lichenibacterium sp. 6Y81]